MGSGVGVGVGAGVEVGSAVGAGAGSGAAAPQPHSAKTVSYTHLDVYKRQTSQSIVNLFPGTAEDARKDGAELLLPTVDTVTYEDGISEEVNGFDVPVPALDEPFNLALIGTKGKWYDHEVIVSNPEKLE